MKHSYISSAEDADKFSEPSNTKDILSEFAAHVASFWGMWIPTIHKHKQTDAWHCDDDLPLVRMQRFSVHEVTTLHDIHGIHWNSLIWGKQGDDPLCTQQHMQVNSLDSGRHWHFIYWW